MRGHRNGYVWLAALVLTTGVALAAQGGARDEVRGRIEAVNAAFMKAVAGGDAAALAAFYASSGQVLPPGSEPVQAKDAIQSFWKGVLDSGVKAADLKTTDLVVGGDVAAETGTYEMKAADGAVLDRGKYVVVWQREQGDWKIYRDIWNSSLAPAAK
ncbi:MAG TPA: DUF4440 domain-containing protein [Candidatus Polarisedimenticolaceae bacterium]|nr:DUF4440 domain-containing protein [Candidatus Polarisedimenticolaceae bacterium]